MAAPDPPAAVRTMVDVQREYRELIVRHFPDLWRSYSAAAPKPQQAVGRFLLAQPDIVIPSPSGMTIAIVRRVEGLLSDIGAFWDRNGERLREAIASSDRTNILVGDLDARSQYYLDSVLQLGLYFDTVCLIDPLSVIAQRARHDPTILVGDAFTRTAMAVLWNLLHVREILDQLPPEAHRPIVAFVPLVGMQWGDPVFDRIIQTATEHTNLLFSDLFGETIKTSGELVRCVKGTELGKLDTKLRANAVTASALAPVGSLAELSSRFRQVHRDPKFERLHKAIGAAADLSILYGMVQAEMLSLESAEVAAASLGVDAGTQPGMYAANVQRIGCNQRCGRRLGLYESEVAAHALLGGELAWCLPESVSQLRYCREAEVLEGVRELFRVQRRSLRNAAPDAKQAAADELVHAVYDNLQKAIGDLERNRDQGLRDLGLSVVKVGASVVFAMICTAFSLPMWTAAPVAALVPTWTLWNVVGSACDSARKERKLLHQPAFILLNLAKAKQLDQELPVSLQGLASEQLLQGLSNMYGMQS